MDMHFLGAKAAILSFFLIMVLGTSGLFIFTMANRQWRALRIAIFIILLLGWVAAISVVDLLIGTMPLG